MEGQRWDREGRELLQLLLLGGAPEALVLHGWGRGGEVGGRGEAVAVAMQDPPIMVAAGRALAVGICKVQISQGAAVGRARGGQLLVGVHGS